MSNAISTVLVSLLVGVSHRSATASDWQQWRGPHRDGTSAEKELLTKWPENGPVKMWETAVQAEGSSRGPGSSPVVAGGKVFVSGRRLAGKEVSDALYCLDAGDGKLLWKHEWPGTFTAPSNGTPAVAGKRVFFVDGSGHFLCLDTADGKVLWRKSPREASPGADINVQYGIAVSPLVDGDVVWVGTGGFRVTDGTPLHPAKSWGGHSSTVLGAIGEKKVLVGHGVGIDAATGKELWTIDRCGAICTPVLVGDRLLNMGVDPDVDVAAPAHVRSYRIKAEGGSFVAEKLWAQPKLPASGNPRYQVPSLVVSGDHAYGRFGFVHATLVCFDLQTGAIRWSAERGQTGMAGECYSSPILADGKLYCLDGMGRLYLVKDDPTAYTLLAKAQVCGPSVASPALAAGRLYVRDGHKVICLKVR